MHVRLYQQRYEDRQCPGHTMFYRLNKQLSMNGTFKRTTKRQRTVTNDKNMLEVLCKLIENPHTSLRVVSSKPKKLINFNKQFFILNNTF